MYLAIQFRNRLSRALFPLSLDFTRPRPRQPRQTSSIRSHRTRRSRPYLDFLSLSLFPFCVGSLLVVLLDVAGVLNNAPEIRRS